MMPHTYLSDGIILFILKVTFAVTNIIASGQDVTPYKDCSSFTFNDEKNCRDTIYWESIAIKQCSALQRSSFFPQQSGSCPSNTYREVIIYCCPPDEYSSEKSRSRLFQNKILNFAQENEKEEFDSLQITRSDNILKQYLTNHTFTSNMSHEKARYNEAKQALSKSYSLRRAALEKELKEAESRISSDDWINHPGLSENEEDSLHSEFRQKFVNLAKDKDVDNEHVERLYRDVVFKQIQRRNTAAIIMWEQVLKTTQPNETQLLQTGEHLLHVIQRNRHDTLLYYRQMVAASNRSETGRWLEECRKSEADLELLLLENILKLEVLPQLGEIVKTKLQKYRDEKYAQLDEAIRAFLVKPVLPGYVPPMTKHEQSLHNADLIIEKYRHHPLKSSNIPPNEGYRRGQPEMIKVDQVKTLSIIETVELPSKEEEQRRVGKPLPDGGVTHSMKNPGDTTTRGSRRDRHLKMKVLVSKPLVRQLPSVPKSQITVLPQRDSQGKRAYVTTVNSYSPAAVIVTYVSMGILMPVVLFVAGRWCLRRFRRYRERAGYTLTTVEVDERLNHWSSDAPPYPNASLKPSTGQASRQNRLSRWQTSGYVNPAYRHKETYFPYQHQTVS